MFLLFFPLQELPFRPDHRGAIAEYTRALEHGYSRQYVTVFNRAWALEAVDDFPAALADYRLTLQLNPYFSQVSSAIRLLRPRAALGSFSPIVGSFFLFFLLL